MSEYITRILTSKGEKQINYESLANLPKSDKTLSQEGSFADAKITGEKITKLDDAKLNINQDAENFGKLLFVSADGSVSLLKLGDGLEIKDGVLCITSKPVTEAILDSAILDVMIL